nr:hypothetical protein Iba_chr09cCG12290 [Ipomoea batatas]
MYPYLDFFNEPDAQELEFMDALGAEEQDLRSHLNARAGSVRDHPVEPPPEEPVNVIHEIPTYPPEMGQSERRTSVRYPNPVAPPRGPPVTAEDSADGGEYASPPRRSAFERLRPSARERLGIREGRRSVDAPNSSYRGDSESSSSHSSRRRHSRARDRVVIWHNPGVRDRIRHNPRYSREVFFVKGFNERLLDLLLHRMSPFCERPCPIAPCEILTDLVVEEGPEESLRFLLITTEEPGQRQGSPCGERPPYAPRSPPLWHDRRGRWSCEKAAQNGVSRAGSPLRNIAKRAKGKTYPEDVLSDHLPNLVGLEVPNCLVGRDDGSDFLEQTCRMLAALSQGIQHRGRAAGRPQPRPAAGGTKVAKMNLRPGVLATRFVEEAASFAMTNHRPERPAMRPAEGGVSFAKHLGRSTRERVELAEESSVGVASTASS